VWLDQLRIQQCNHGIGSMSEQRAWHHSANSRQIHRFGHSLDFDSVGIEHEEQVSLKLVLLKLQMLHWTVPGGKAKQVGSAASRVVMVMVRWLLPGRLLMDLARVLRTITFNSSAFVCCDRFPSDLLHPRLC
jgi:hypothetical protein